MIAEAIELEPMSSRSRFAELKKIRGSFSRLRAACERERAKLSHLSDACRQSGRSVFEEYSQDDHRTDHNERGE